MAFADDLYEDPHLATSVRQVSTTRIIIIETHKKICARKLMVVMM